MIVYILPCYSLHLSHPLLPHCTHTPMSTNLFSMSASLRMDGFEGKRLPSLDSLLLRWEGTSHLLEWKGKLFFLPHMPLHPQWGINEKCFAAAPPCSDTLSIHLAGSRAVWQPYLIKIPLPYMALLLAVPCLTAMKSDFTLIPKVLWWTDPWAKWFTGGPRRLSRKK